MKVIERGHVYDLDVLDDPTGDVVVRLTFVNREEGSQHAGTQTQDVIRALIDRTFHCDDCLPDDLNADIIYHLRMALVFHEMRALRRKAEKGVYEPERVIPGIDGHFKHAGRIIWHMEAPRRDMRRVNPSGPNI